MTSIDDRIAALRTRQQDLQARMSSIESELEGHDAKDFEDMATEREGDEVLEDMGQSAQQELRMIEAALARADEGEYGFCVRCGAEIDEGRLDILPATPFCATCAAQVAAGG